MYTFFQDISPEQAGISSHAILSMLDRLEENQVNIHGFCLMRGDRIVSEGYWKPFHKSFQHRMYSVGKSFTSLAIGFMEQDGLLRLDDCICKFFPEKLKKRLPHPYIAQTTIRDMLRMASPHHASTYKTSNSDDWVESFFITEPTHIPGTVFAYDTSATHVLSALVEKLSGQSLLDYLRLKFLNVLDFSEEAMILPDPVGTSQGGSGLLCTLEDLYKTAYVLMNGGKWKNKQLLPAHYLATATAKQIDTSSQLLIEERQGYGYQFWKSRNGGFALYGMGGQLAICLPEYQTVFVTIADTLRTPAGVQELCEAFWHQVFPFIEKSRLPEGGWKALPENPFVAKQLENRLSALTLPPMVRGEKFSPWARRISGKRFIFQPNPMELKFLRLTFEGEHCQLEYEKRGSSYRIPFAMGGIEAFHLNASGTDWLSSAAWVSNELLILHASVISKVLGSVRAQFYFTGNRVTLALKKTAEKLLNGYEGFTSGEMEL